jgi:PKD domain
MVTNNGINIDSVVQMNNNNGVAISSTIGLVMDSSGLLTATNNTAGIITWNWGDGTNNTGNSVTHNYNNAGTFTIITNIQSGSDSVQLSNTITVSNNTFVRRPSFTMQVNNNSNTTQNLQSAIITVKKNGKIYTSYKNNPLLNQRTKPIIKIIESVNGENNPQGLKTKVINAQLDIYVYNIANNADSIKVKSTNMIMAVAVPN